MRHPSLLGLSVSAAVCTDSRGQSSTDNEQQRQQQLQCEQLWCRIEKVGVVVKGPDAIAKVWDYHFLAFYKKLAFCCQPRWQQGQHY